MRTYEEARAAAQQRVVFEGLSEALALEDVGTLHVTAVAVLFDGEAADGSDTFGLLSFDEAGAHLADDATIALLTVGSLALSLRRLQPRADGLEEGDSDVGA